MHCSKLHLIKSIQILNRLKIIYQLLQLLDICILQYSFTFYSFLYPLVCYLTNRLCLLVVVGTTHGKTKYNFLIRKIGFECSPFHLLKWYIYEICFYFVVINRIQKFQHMVHFPFRENFRFSLRYRRLCNCIILDDNAKTICSKISLWNA